ncbi:unnamed protein product [Heterotrigona itama]|uniref:RING-type domain-containing protein n=1 Tax=Heterotrigona itama TaxID=395501 RepID=A0A6V7H7B3_9HYME|nr:unnamed protein product [Heterotrigona itama]
MELFVCNNCFATPHRGKKPFCLTQCGHIYCNGCIRQGNNKHRQTLLAPLLVSETHTDTRETMPAMSTDRYLFRGIATTLAVQSRKFLRSVERIVGIVTKDIWFSKQSDKNYARTLSRNLRNVEVPLLQSDAEHESNQGQVPQAENGEHRTKEETDVFRDSTFEIQGFKLFQRYVHAKVQQPENFQNEVHKPTSNSYVSSRGTNVSSSKSFNATKGKATLDSFRIPFDPRAMRSIDSRATSTANSTYL